MTLGEKLAKLYREINYTQEQLADILEASRQAISIGIVSFGTGEFSFDVLPLGKYFSIGDHAYAMIAIGQTKSTSSEF